MAATNLRSGHARMGKSGASRSTPRRVAADALERRAMLAAVLPDLPFGGGDGIATAVFAGMGGVARAVAVQGDGKIVAVGSVVTNPANTDDTDLAIARFDADGSLDRTFAGTGMVIDDRMDIATSVSIRPGGAIFVAGIEIHSGAPNPSELAMMRYRPDGTPDPTFGDNGLLIIDVPGMEGSAASPVFQPDGKMLFAGSAVPAGGNTRVSLFARLLPDFSPDPTFGGGDGFATPAFGGPSVVVLSDGRFVTGGTAGRPDVGLGDFELARFLADGSVDASFGRGGADGDGRTVVDIGGHDLGMGLARARDGGYTVVGYTINNGNQTNIADYALAHFTADGTLDRAFGGGDGIATFDGGLEDYVSAVLPLPDGRILVTGNRNSEDRPVGLARFLPDGTPDLSFGGTGSVKVGSGMPIDVGLALQPDGKILVAGAAGGADPYGWTFAVARVFEGDAPPPPPVFTYQAEHARRRGVPVETNHAGFTGTGFVDFAPRGGDFVEFTIDVPTAGQHLLEFRYANGSDNARQLSLAVDGGNVDGPMRFDPTGSWSRWGSASKAVTLAPGRHRVRVTSLVNGPNLDALTVRAVPNPVPAITLQAESAFSQGPAVASAHGGYTGSGYVDYRHGEGDFVEFRIEVPKTSRYILDFRYANGSTSDRPLRVTLNGEMYMPPPSFEPTGSWSTWRTVSQFAALEAGVTLVRLTAIGSGGANLDALTVRPAV